MISKTVWLDQYLIILYKQYEERRLNYFKNRSKHSKYDSENLMFELLKEILTSYSELDFITQYRLKTFDKRFFIAVI